MGELRGMITAILMLAFVALTVWIASGRHKQRFDVAARAPLEDDSVSDSDSLSPGGRGLGRGECQ